MNVRLFTPFLLFCFLNLHAAAQTSTEPSSTFDRKNTWSLFTEYAKESTPILMGFARQRKLITLGGGYTRRVVRFAGTELGYHAEVRPLIFESDPVDFETSTASLPGSSTPFNTFSFSYAPPGSCRAGTTSFTVQQPPPTGPVVLTNAITCGRQWTFAQAFSPLGFKYSLVTRRPLQPYLIGTLGYMYASRPIPTAQAEAFNFAFDFGAGFELYRTRTRSVAFESRYHHFSNHNTAQQNPGVDNILFHLAYNFGR